MPSASSSLVPTSAPFTSADFDRILNALVRLSNDYHRSACNRNLSAGYRKAFKREWTHVDPEFSATVTVDRALTFARGMVAAGFSFWRMTPSKLGKVVALCLDNRGGGTTHLGACNLRQLIDLQNSYFVRLGEQPPDDEGLVLFRPAHDDDERRLSADIRAALLQAALTTTFPQRHHRTYLASIYANRCNKLWQQLDPTRSGKFHHVAQAFAFADTMIQRHTDESWNGYVYREAPLWASVIRRQGYITVQQFIALSENAGRFRTTWRRGSDQSATADGPNDSATNVSQSDAETTPDLPWALLAEMSSPPPSHQTLCPHVDPPSPAQAPASSTKEAGSHDTCDDASRLCVACLTNERNSLCLPCRHVELCGRCAGDPRMKDQPCSLCRCVVVARVQIFL